MRPAEFFILPITNATNQPKNIKFTKSEQTKQQVGYNYQDSTGLLSEVNVNGKNINYYYENNNLLREDNRRLNVSQELLRQRQHINVYERRLPNQQRRRGQRHYYLLYLQWRQNDQIRESNVRIRRHGQPYHLSRKNSDMEGQAIDLIQRQHLHL